MSRSALSLNSLALCCALHLGLSATVHSAPLSGTPQGSQRPHRPEPAPTSVAASLSSAAAQVGVQTHVDGAQLQVINRSGGDSGRVQPPPAPAIPASMVAAGPHVVTQTECGPLQSLKRSEVKGVVVGYFSESEVPQGHSDELEPLRENGRIKYYDEQPLTNAQGQWLGVRRFGHQVVMQHAVISTSAARQGVLGGGAGSGAWTQGSAGGSSAMQQTVTKIQLRLCELAPEWSLLAPTPVRDLPPAVAAATAGSKPLRRRPKCRC